MKRQGLRIPPRIRAKLDELNQVWTKTRIFRKLVNRPGSLKITVPTPDGMTVVSLKVESGGQSLGQMIAHLHRHLSISMGVLMSFDNAVSLRDVVVQVRAEGKREAQLRTRMIVSKEGGRVSQPILT